MRHQLADRLLREVQHGASATAVRQAEIGWDSAAGKIRRRRRSEFLLRGLPRDARILEIGAGTGMHTVALLEVSKDVEAIDISPDLLAVARNRAPGAKYHVMDAHKPVFAPESFDAIVGVSILHHLNWKLALSAYQQLLKPGGIVRFSEPNLLNPQILLQKSIPFLKRLAGDSPDEYAFTRGEIARSLASAGFEKIRVQPYEFLHPRTPERFIPLVMRVESWIERTPLNEIAGSLLIEASKPLGPAASDIGPSRTDGTAPPQEQPAV
jgi:SAM-dependent methyltransferase